MILTHLVLLEFYPGASPVVATDTFSGFTTHPVLMFFDGFSSIEGFSGFTTHQPHAFFDGFTGAVVGGSDTFGGFTTHMPLAHFDGFSGVEGTGPGAAGTYIPTFRTRRGR